MDFCKEAGRPTVLVVDDHELMRRVIGLMLRRVGYDAVLAGDGVQALEAFDRNWDRVGAALVDEHMAGPSGRETVRALRRAAPGLPCCLMDGGSPGDGDPEGDVPVVDKPFTWDSLLAVLRRLFPAR